MFNVIRVTLFLAATVNAALSPSSIDSDLSILIHNDLLEGNSTRAGSGVLLLDPMPLQKAIETCHSLGETLWSYQAEASEIKNDLDYLTFQGKYSKSQKYWIAPVHNIPSTINANGKVQRAFANTHLPALCTQSAPYSNSDSQDTSSRWQVSVQSNNEYLTGFRDRVSFRFLGIRYAPQPKRWTYSQLYEGAGDDASALEYGSECPQSSSGAEDCFFLNIWTPYLPKSTRPKKEKLKPVMFWIHGGAFQTGTGSDPTVDGGNLASRGDVVVVTTNYRLGNLGFLALDDGTTNGNYGLADQIIALEWVQRNIRDFGGDPDRVTIFGQSAGAGSVRALLASPKSRGKFAGAVMLSNLGGVGYGTTYSEYYSITEEMEVVGNDILSETNCTNASSRIDCLRELSASTIINLSASARYLVVDGEYLLAPELGLTNPKTTANVPLLLGTTRDDGAAFIAYPSDNETIQEFLNASDLPSNVVPSPVFPIPSGTNHTLDIFNTSARICTDGVFRCIDQATAYAGLKNHIFPSIFFYEFNRTYQMPGWSPNPPLCQAPITPEFPYGDPSMEYFKCHSGELYYVFGNILRVGLPLRDDFDLPFEQYVLDSWASFARSADPTPDLRFLEARGYVNTTREVERTGSWDRFQEGSYKMRRLQWPSETVDLDENLQCRALNLSLSYYTT
ncbi:Carboxylesterase type B [Penicillium tannophilum]|nr:Carboxylesterase type B [Penicillium tannophilum]